MYINPFVCGVLVTLGVEMALILAYALLHRSDK